MAKTPRTKCLEALQKLVRLKAADDNGYAACVSCGQMGHWKEMDGGHYIPKGHSSYWALDECNVHPQCKSCNAYGMRFGTAAQEYTKWMIDYYGRDFVDDMEQKKRLTKKMYKSDYDDMLAELNAEIKHHLERVGNG